MFLSNTEHVVGVSWFCETHHMAIFHVAFGAEHQHSARPLRSTVFESLFGRGHVLENSMISKFSQRTHDYLAGALTVGSGEENLMLKRRLSILSLLDGERT